MVGTTKMVSKVPSDIPPTITQPICERVSAPAPVARARGTAPSTMAPVVIRMGRRRWDEALTSASTISMPSSRSWLVNSTIKMPCLVMSPTSVMSPICEYTLSEPPLHCSASSAPIMDSGTDTMMTSGSMKLSNCAASTRKMNTSASTKTTPKAPCELLNSREVPFKSVV